MQIREVYEYCLTELNKVLAPSLLLNDFVYFFNKAIQLYFNKRYNLFEINQLLTDDLRVLSKSVRLNAVAPTTKIPVAGGGFRYKLPDDYVHILNCICEFKVNKGRKGCENMSETIYQGANKLDTAQWSSIITNYYTKPSITLPYYYIINIEDPTESGDYPNRKDKETGQRYGNFKTPIIEIKCGNIKPSAVYIDYLRAPEFTQIKIDDLDNLDDSTANLEFPDYVVYEIINEFIRIVLENEKDQLRTQTFTPINQSIPSQK